MSYIIESSGKQYKANKGDKLVLNSINAQVGDLIDLNVIANLENSEFSCSTIKGRVESHIKGNKVIIFKKKRRHGYERKRGYRNMLTVVRLQKDEVA